MRFGVILTASIMLVAGCSYAPRHDIRPEPAFIQAAIQPGDRVVIVTNDGLEIDMVVKSVEPNGLKSESERVLYSDIATLTLLAWREPAHPCGNGVPVGCSIPEVITAVSSYHQRFSGRFHAVCAEHDYCYRHGYATYGETRLECDDLFYRRMQNECGATKWYAILSTDVLKDQAECVLAAEEMYTAVRRYGEKHFQTTTSTYCEYEGPP